MSRQILKTIVVACALLLPLDLTYAQTSLLDDFSSGNDDNWRQIDLLPTGAGPGKFEVVEQSYRLTSVNPTHNPGMGAFLLEDNADFYGTGFLQAKVRNDSTGALAGVTMRNHRSGAYLFVGRNETGRFLIGRTAQSEPYREYIVPGVTFRTGENWNIEGGVVDGRLSMKVWADGEPVPDYPQLVVYDRAELPVREGLGLLTYVDVGATPARLDANFDDVYFTSSLTGDLNYTSALDAGDIDLISEAIREGNRSRWFDVNYDRRVDHEDRETWIHDLQVTWIGDANLDGQFNSTDLTAVFAAGEYEDGELLNSGWATGDWNGDGDFTSGDLVVAFQDSGYEQGPRPVPNEIPEPSSVVILVTGLIWLARLKNW